MSVNLTKRRTVLPGDGVASQIHYHVHLLLDRGNNREIDAAECQIELSLLIPQSIPYVEVKLVIDKTGMLHMDIFMRSEE